MMTTNVHEPIPMWLPHIGPEVIEAATQALEIGYLGLGKATKRFEDQLSGYLELDDQRVPMSTNSCTAALNCACMLAGAGPGDEVIAPSFTYVAAHQAVTATGADVDFCYIEEPTLTVDPDKLRELISERTKAIMVCHFAGLVGRLDEVYQVAAEHGLRVIEDAAHAIGTRRDGMLVGATGDLVCFSFGPVKTHDHPGGRGDRHAQPRGAADPAPAPHARGRQGDRGALPEPVCLGVRRAPPGLPLPPGRHPRFDRPGPARPAGRVRAQPPGVLPRLQPAPRRDPRGDHPRLRLQGHRPVHLLHPRAGLRPPGPDRALEAARGPDRDPLPRRPRVHLLQGRPPRRPVRHRPGRPRGAHPAALVLHGRVRPRPRRRRHQGVLRLAVLR